MSVSAKKIFGSALASGVCALAFAGAAQALEVGECVPKSQIANVMYEEGQTPLIKAQRRAVGGSKTNFFTSSSDFSHGYIIEEQGSDYCVTADLSDIILNDLRGGKKPQNVTGGRNLDRNLEEGASNGYYPMFQAFARSTETQGYITIFYNGKGGDGALGATGSQGTTMGAGYSSVSYTKNAIQYFDSQEKVSLSMR